MAGNKNGQREPVAPAGESPGRLVSAARKRPGRPWWLDHQTRTWLHRWDVDPRGGHPFAVWRRLRPTQLFALSFLLLIGLGTLGLKLLPGLYTGPGLGWVDALFTATSAVCVTGLIVVDTANYFTPFGQAYLLVLIQLGGLGIITFTTLLILTLGQRLSLRTEAVSGSLTEVAPHIDYRSLTRSIVRFTLLAEASGALLLYLFWTPRFGFLGAFWPAIFHAVSAFCNAGFSVFSDSLISFQRAPLTLLVVLALIVAGGLGFLTLEELDLLRRSRSRGTRPVLSLHSKLALSVTGVLILSGWTLFSVFEWRVTLEHLPVWSRLVNALFMSVTPRTAGFNTVDYGQASDNANFLNIILMSIGGSPGSTAGGLKTTTVALIGLLAWARFRGREIVSIWGRSVPPETVQRAVGLFVVGFGAMTAAIFLLTALELSGYRHLEAEAGFLEFMFETASAFNTVGLSMGVTPELSPASRLLVILLMYVGRVGPLTFAAAIALDRPSPSGEFRYAYEDVVIG